tara:strand:- start:547 stop:723 length:177 start_codon:yes stop_codon:yes gene_type:complete
LHKENEVNNPKMDAVVQQEQDRKTNETTNESTHKRQKLSVLADLYQGKNPNKKKIGLA